VRANEPCSPARTFRRLDTSEKRATFLLECPGGARLRVTEAAKLSLEMHWSGCSTAEIAEKLRRSGHRPTEEREVAGYVGALLNRVALLEAQGEGPVEPSFGFRRVLFPAALAGRIAAKLTWLFGRATILTLSAVAFCGWQIIHLRAPVLTPQDTLLGYALFFLTLFAHEFGHSAACARFGARPGNIGLTIYLLFPALYSDVGSVWALPRWQRVIVDLGGAYFQMLVALLYFAAFTVTHSTALQIALVFIFATLVFNMNPVFKFDGYWMISDALGVTNLSRQPIRVIRYALARLAGRAREALPWKASMIALLIVYTLVSVAVWLVFVVRMGMGIVARVKVLADSVTPNTGHPIPYWQILFSIFGLVMAFYLIARLSHRAVRAFYAVRGA
jgi:putative peptide zinc metalloprotease protein